ncbi:hypothetical protein C8R44DRAFT_767493, partial [Mycena epipterygia]
MLKIRARYQNSSPRPCTRHRCIGFHRGAMVVHGKPPFTHIRHLGVRRTRSSSGRF